MFINFHKLYNLPIKILNCWRQKIKVQHIKMMHYTVQPKNSIFVKDYGFLSFSKDVS